MPLPDAAAPTHRTDGERIALLELDMDWVKKTTQNNFDVTNGKLDKLLFKVDGFEDNLEQKLKQDLHTEFNERFVPKKALWIAMGVSMGVGIMAGASFQPLALKLITLMA